MANRRSPRADSPGNAPTRKFRSTGSSGGVADWATATDSLIKEVICAASIFDGAIRFGLSADGGAYSIGIYGDGAPYTTWVPCADDIDDTLRELIEYLATVADQRAAERRTKG